MLALVVAMIPGLYMLRSNITTSMDDTRTSSEAAKKDALNHVDASKLQAASANASKAAAAVAAIQAQQRAADANKTATCVPGSPTNPCDSLEALKYQAWRGWDGGQGYTNTPWACGPPQFGVVTCERD